MNLALAFLWYGSSAMGCDSFEWSIQWRGLHFISSGHNLGAAALCKLSEGHSCHKHQDLLRTCSVSILNLHNLRPWSLCLNLLLFIDCEPQSEFHITVCDGANAPTNGFQPGRYCGHAALDVGWKPRSQLTSGLIREIIRHWRPATCICVLYASSAWHNKTEM